jgi:hypothetical protein
VAFARRESCHAPARTWASWSRPDRCPRLDGVDVRVATAERVDGPSESATGAPPGRKDAVASSTAVPCAARDDVCQVCHSRLRVTLACTLACSAARPSRDASGHPATRFLRSGRPKQRSMMVGAL